MWGGRTQIVGVGRKCCCLERAEKQAAGKEPLKTTTEERFQPSEAAAEISSIIRIMNAVFKTGACRQSQPQFEHMVPRTEFCAAGKGVTKCTNSLCSHPFHRVKNSGGVAALPGGCLWASPGAGLCLPPSASPAPVCAVLSPSRGCPHDCKDSSCPLLSLRRGRAAVPSAWLGGTCAASAQRGLSHLKVSGAGLQPALSLGVELPPVRAKGAFMWAAAAAAAASPCWAQGPQGQ